MKNGSYIVRVLSDSGWHGIGWFRDADAAREAFQNAKKGVVPSDYDYLIVGGVPDYWSVEILQVLDFASVE